MRIMIIGAEGQLGTELRKIYDEKDVIPVNHNILDICDLDGVRAMVSDMRPDVVFNTAAAHNVPKCEDDPAWAFNVNACGTRNVARACQESGARFVHVSTDYVFGDGGTRPFVESDMPAPLSIYGASKLAGEHLAVAECDDSIIVRTAALYGPAPCRAKGGRNFVALMLFLAQTKPELKVVTDEITTPTSSIALAPQLKKLAEHGAPGLYHATCQGHCSWHEFAKTIFEIMDVKTPLIEATRDDFPSPVKRPHYSVLENRRLQEAGIDVLPHWREALEGYLATSDPSLTAV